MSNIIFSHSFDAKEKIDNAEFIINNRTVNIKNIKCVELKFNLSEDNKIISDIRLEGYLNKDDSKDFIEFLGKEQA